VPAFVIPNVIKWHWWRFNGYGFFAGMVTGTLSALVLLFIGKPEYMARLGLEAISLHPVYVKFPIIMILSTIASIGVCLVTKPEEDAVLKSFYRTVRPWGFWQPIYEKCRAEDPSIQPNRDFWRDWFNIAVGIVWELAMVASPIFLVIQQYGKALIGLVIFLMDLRDPEVHLVQPPRTSRRNRQAPRSPPRPNAQLRTGASSRQTPSQLGTPSRPLGILRFSPATWFEEKMRKK